MCEHENIEWYDEEGVCEDCGARCSYHIEIDYDDNYPEYIKKIEVKVPDHWYKKGE